MDINSIFVTKIFVYLFISTGFNVLLACDYVISKDLPFPLPFPTKLLDGGLYFPKILLANDTHTNTMNVSKLVSARSNIITVRSNFLI